jgi:hypothetical protein
MDGLGTWVSEEGWLVQATIFPTPWRLYSDAASPRASGRKEGTMGKQSRTTDDEMSVVLVDRESNRALVRFEGDGRLPGAPHGSVTVEGIRRAAKRVREQQDGRNLGAIAEATIRRDDWRPESRPA